MNKKIIKDRFPLPIIEDLIDTMQGGKVFSTLDLKNGYFHVPVAPESQKYTAFTTPSGHYEFLRVPFGLCVSPAIFQRFINTIFSDLIADGTIIIYMDEWQLHQKTKKKAMKN